MSLENIDFEAEWERFKKAVGKRRFHVYKDGDVVSHATTETEDGGYTDEFYCNISISVLKIWHSIGLVIQHNNSQGYQIVDENA